MPDRIVKHWQELLDWQKSRSQLRKLNSGADPRDLARLEVLVEESLPEDFKTLYLAHDGERTGKGDPVLFGQGFMSVAEITREIERSKDRRKPSERTLAHPARSKELTDQIVQSVKDKVGKKRWEKLVFECSPGAIGGPYLYPKAGRSERSILDLSDKAFDEIDLLVEELMALEKHTFNWDGLDFVVFSSGEYEVSRNDFDLAEFATSYPKGAIKKAYFHFKWIPIFKYHEGNFIGCDLDPGAKGSKGQIIIYGRDEDDMFVAAKSLSRLFALFLDVIKKTSRPAPPSLFSLEVVSTTS